MNTYGFFTQLVDGCDDPILAVHDCSKIQSKYLAIERLGEMVRGRALEPCALPEYLESLKTHPCTMQVVQKFEGGDLNIDDLDLEDGVYTI